MGYKNKLKIEWYADFFACDQCDNKERFDYAEIPGRPWYDDWGSKSPLQHDWQVVTRLPGKGDRELASPLAFCSQSCMTAYMDVLVEHHYRPVIKEEVA